MEFYFDVVGFKEKMKYINIPTCVSSQLFIVTSNVDQGGTQNFKIYSWFVGSILYKLNLNSKNHLN